MKNLIKKILKEEQLSLFDDEITTPETRYELCSY